MQHVVVICFMLYMAVGLWRESQDSSLIGTASGLAQVITKAPSKQSLDWSKCVINEENNDWQMHMKYFEASNSKLMKERLYVWNGAKLDESPQGFDTPATPQSHRAEVSPGCFTMASRLSSSDQEELCNLLVWFAAHQDSERRTLERESEVRRGNESHGLSQRKQTGSKQTGQLV